MNETKTYPDGSARVGAPPFPKLSPLEEAQGKQEPDADDGQDEEGREPARRGRRPRAQE